MHKAWVLQLHYVDTITSCQSCLVGISSSIWRSPVQRCSPHMLTGLAGWLHYPFNQLWGGLICFDQCGHHNWPSSGLPMLVCHSTGCHLRPLTAVHSLWHPWNHWKWPRNPFHRLLGQAMAGPDEHWLVIPSPLQSHRGRTDWMVHWCAEGHPPHQSALFCGVGGMPTRSIPDS